MAEQEKQLAKDEKQAAKQEKKEKRQAARVAQKNVAKKNHVKLSTRIKEGWQGFKSDLRKISWFPWDQTRKSTLVVIVLVLISMVFIGLLDFAFSKGIVAISGLF